MKFYNENIVQQARNLRKNGSSSKVIAQILGISDSTVLRWCYDIKATKENGFSKHQKEIYKAVEMKAQNVLQDFNFTVNNAKILTTILYYCEGSRYPTINCVCFTNSDPEIVKLFIRLFRLGFKPNEHKFRVHLQLHSTHNKLEAKKYWADLLKIDESQFYKPTITNPTNRMKRLVYRGTCSVRYYDFKIVHEILGIWKNLISKI